MSIITVLSGKFPFFLFKINAFFTLSVKENKKIVCIMSSMRNVKSIIIENFDKQDTSFVFPSEITAAFWRMRSLDSTGRSAVRSERFLSWDTFKERYFSLNQKGTPVNKIVRTLFTVSFLEKNSQSGGSLLSSLIPSDYAENSAAFKKLILSLLPRIAGLIKKINDERVPFPRPLLKDLAQIHEEYTGFLQKHDLFEPGWMKADVSEVEGIFYLFYPEVIEDYKDFSIELSASDHIIIVPLSDKVSPSILRFPTASAEIKWLLKQIRDLLDKGIPPDEISITLPDMDGWRDRLETMASIRNIPLSLKEGRPVSEFSGARIFRMLSDCSKTGFSSTAMKQLFLNGSVPWIEEKKAHALVLFGIGNHCFRNYYRKGKEVDLWEKALRSSGDHELLLYYRSFKQNVQAISGSKTFSQLKRAIQQFITHFLNTDELERGGMLKAFQFALEILNTVIEDAAACGSDAVKSPFDIWLSFLDEIIYVSRENKNGIAVYPYRVAGGIETLWHFIPGFSQRTFSVSMEDYSFLREDQKVFFTDTVHDFSDYFLSLYSMSGKNVVFSMSKVSFSGPEIPPPEFLTEGKVDDFQERIGDIQDVFDCEIAYWNGETPMHPKIVPVMRTGLERAQVSVFSKKQIDYTRKAVSSSNLLNEVRKAFFHGKDTMRVSSTMLDAFYTCPYAFFLQRVLSVSENQYEMVFKDHQLIGRLIHDCFLELFSFIDRKTGVFDPGKRNLYREYVPKLVLSVMAQYERDGMIMLGPVWEEVRTYLISHLGTFLDIEAETFPLYKLESAEKSYGYDVEDDIRIEGRIDRISVRNGIRCIIDYKKNYTTSLSRLNPEEGVPESFQLFFYILLAESEGEKISRAAYYNVTKDTYVTVFSDPPEKKSLSRETVDEISAQMKTSIRSMKEQIQSGDFSVSDCGSCSFRNICRVRYTVR